MRFAYIDSHGNEVPIPSVDALALRIELGAIGPETQVYDAQADRWGPASTHEIYHTLARDAQAEGFVAPPPPVAPPPSTPPQSATPASSKSKLKSGPRPPAAAPTSAPDLGLTLAEPTPTPPKKASKPAPLGDADELPLLDLAPPMEAKPLAGGSRDVPGQAGPPMGGGATFDYGDLGSGLQLEDSTPSAPMPAGLGGGIVPDNPMQFGGGGGGELQLEEPMSAFRPDSPPGWMEQSPPGGALDFSMEPVPAAAEEPALAPAEDAPARQRRTPKDRPPPPKFKSSSRSMSGPIVLTVAVLALGVGGYVGWPLVWPMVNARLNPPPPPVRPAVVLPAIPAELVPLMREMAEGAVADAIAEVDANTRVPDAPIEPDQQWLSGNYLANASQFASIEAFWSSMGAFMDGVLAAEWQLYHDKVVARVQAAGIAAETAAMIVERADSGFVAAEEPRRATYASMDGVVDAALALHEFLVQNEDNIEYTPATTSTADPVLEAVPNTTALRDQMLERVDDITEALDAFGTLDRVTRERLTSALVARVQQVGIRYE